jgi:transcriptional regulator with XRE-family HTH domain
VALVKLNTAALKRLRLAGGFTQSALAARAGITKVTLTYVERGEQEPRISTVIKLAVALDVQVSDLMADDQDEVA